MSIMLTGTARERRHASTMNIDRLSTLDMLNVIHQDDAQISSALTPHLSMLARVVDNAAATLSHGGRLVLTGAGASGRVAEQAAEAFANAGLETAHEVSLAPRCRIDFMVGDIGVEIKKKRPQRAPLVAQLTRYANCPQIARLIVLAPRGVDLPKSIGGKPVTMMSLEKLWGIMLP